MNEIPTTEMIPARGANIGCPVCGKPLASCEGHFGANDPDAMAILDRHDDGNHTMCHPDGCANAGVVIPATAPVARPVPTVVHAPPVATPTPATDGAPAWLNRVVADGLAVTRPEPAPITEEAPVTEEAPAPVVAPAAPPVAAPAPTAGINWDEPPAAVKRFDWGDTVVALKANPSKWANVLETDERAHANRCRNALRYHGITTRQKTKGGIITVWACMEVTA